MVHAETTEAEGLHLGNLRPMDVRRSTIVKTPPRRTARPHAAQVGIGDQYPIGEALPPGLVVGRGRIELREINSERLHSHLPRSLRERDRSRLAK